MTLRAGEVYRSPLYDRVDRRAAFIVWAGHLPEGSNLEVVIEHKDPCDATLVHAGSLYIHDAAVHMSVCSGIKEQYRYRCTFMGHTTGRSGQC